MSIRSFHVSGYFTTVKPIYAGFFITSETSPDSCASTDEVALHTQHWSHAMALWVIELWTMQMTLHGTWMTLDWTIDLIIINFIIIKSMDWT